MSEQDKVYLSQLEEVQILWPGDVRVLAEFILRSWDVRDSKAKGDSIQKSRPTINGLTSYFASITQIPRLQIEQQFKSYGFSLAATVEFDLTPNAVAAPMRL